jgi:hypothetical protein
LNEALVPCRLTKDHGIIHNYYNENFTSGI